MKISNKFRAWDGEKFLYLDLDKDFTDIGHIDWLRMFQRLPKQRFTGWYDHTFWSELKRAEKKEHKEIGITEKVWKGKEIYFGDIVTSNRLDNKGIWVIGMDVFGDFYYEDIKTGEKRDAGGMIDGGAKVFNTQKCNIVGNIYQNKELLQGYSLQRLNLVSEL